MDDEGRVVHPEREPKLTGDELRRLFRAITLQRILDDRMMRLQREGRIGFYLSCIGEEGGALRDRARAARQRLDLHRLPRDRRRAVPRVPAAHVHVPDVRQRRGSGARGGRCPCTTRRGSWNFVSISSPVGSQIPHAVGAAWAAKLQKKDDVAVGFFGEGATSTPTFHVSANFAARVQDPGHPDLPQQRLGDLGAAFGADGVADVRAEGGRLRTAGRPGRRQRRPGDDPRRSRGGGARRGAARGRR